MASSIISVTAGPTVRDYSLAISAIIDSAGNNPGDSVTTLQGLKSLFQFIDFDHTQSPSYSQYVRNRMSEGNQEALEVIAEALSLPWSEIAVLFGNVYAKYGGGSYLLWGCVQKLRDYLKIGNPQDFQSCEAELREMILNQCELKLQSKGLDESLLRDLINWESGVAEVGGVTHSLEDGSGYHPGNSVEAEMKTIAIRIGGSVWVFQDDSTEEQLQAYQNVPLSGFGVIENGLREAEVVEAEPKVVLENGDQDQDMPDHEEKIRVAAGNRKTCSYCSAVFRNNVDKKYHMKCTHSTLFFDMPRGTLETDVDAAVAKIRMEGLIHSASHQRRFHCQLCRETTRDRSMKVHMLQHHLPEVICRLTSPIPGPSGATLRQKSRPSSSCNMAKYE